LKIDDQVLFGSVKLFLDKIKIPGFSGRGCHFILSETFFFYF